MRMRIPAPPRSGEQVVTLEEIHKAYGENIVYEGLSERIIRGERVALAGPNGAGKSTLLRILAGVLPIDQGAHKLGHNVKAAFFAQHQLESLDASRSILEELETDARTEDVPRIRGQLGAFLFSGDEVDKKISVLSGGEKARVALAKLLLRPVNLLVLDEPTNHLDIESCEILEEALSTYEGTLVFVSHDRAFINALATRVIEVTPGQVRDFSGNYDDYLQALDRLERRSTEADRTPSPRPEPSDARSQSDPTPSNDKKQAQSSASTAGGGQRERRKQRDRIVRKSTRVEEKIQSHEAALVQLDWRLGDPAVYSDADQVTQVQSEQATLRSELEVLYADWERLSDELAAVEDLLAD